MHILFIFMILITILPFYLLLLKSFIKPTNDYTDLMIYRTIIITTILINQFEIILLMIAFIFKNISIHISLFLFITTILISITHRKITSFKDNTFLIYMRVIVLSIYSLVLLIFIIFFQYI